MYIPFFLHFLHGNTGRNMNGYFTQAGKIGWKRLWCSFEFWHFQLFIQFLLSQSYGSCIFIIYTINTMHVTASSVGVPVDVYLTPSYKVAVRCERHWNSNTISPSFVYGSNHTITSRL